MARSVNATRSSTSAGRQQHCNNAKCSWLETLNPYLRMHKPTSARSCCSTPAIASVRCCCVASRGCTATPLLLPLALQRWKTSGNCSSRSAKLRWAYRVTARRQNDIRQTQDELAGRASPQVVPPFHLWGGRILLEREAGRHRAAAPPAASSAAGPHPQAARVMRTLPSLTLPSGSPRSCRPLRGPGIRRLPPPLRRCCRCAPSAGILV